MPNNVWCDNEDCIYHEDDMCDMGDLAIDCNGCCMGSLREYEEYKRSKPVAETRRIENPYAEENEQLRELVADLVEDWMDNVCPTSFWCKRDGDYVHCEDERCGNLVYKQMARDLGVEL